MSKRTMTPMQGERAILELIRLRFPQRDREGCVGDDAAIVSFGDRAIVSTDMLVEGVDFTSDTPLELLGARSLAVNLSDLAAMGAAPHSFLLALAIPFDRVPLLDRLLTSMAAAAGRYDIQLIGGDLSSAEKMVISITVFGQVNEGGRPLLRSGAHAGDRIYLSRPVGGAHAGLALLRSGWKVSPAGEILSTPNGRAFGYAEREFAAAAIRRQLQPEPEIALGQILSKLESVTACIDVSDGLSTDLHHLCEASGVGAVIEWERVPVFADLEGIGRFLGLDPEKAAINGGEEFALLFTSTLRESELSAIAGRPVYAIGIITESRDILMERSGARTPLHAAGFDHFASGL